MAGENSRALEIQARAVHEDGAALLVAEHERLIAGCAAKGCDDDAADDVAQSARLRLWEWARRRGHRHCARSLVRRAVRCAAIESMRQRERSPCAIGAPHVDAIDAASDSPLLAVQAADADVIAKRLVNAWLAGLPLRLRAIYCGLYRRCLSQRELARRLRVTQPRIAQYHADLLRLGRERFGAAPSA